MALNFCLANNLEIAAKTREVTDIEDGLLDLIRRKYISIFSPTADFIFGLDPYGETILTKSDILKVYEISKFLLERLNDKEVSNLLKKEFDNVQYFDYDDLIEFTNDLNKITKKAIDEEQGIIVVGD
jgi:hypothetical protein